MSARNNDQYTSIVGRLISLQERTARLDAIKGAVFAFGIALIGFGILIGITAIGWPGKVVRTIIDFLILAALGIVIYIRVITPLIKKPGLLDIARKLERHYGEFQSRLIGALELYDRAVQNRENYSLELIEKTIEEAGGVISEIDTDVIIERRPLLRTSIRSGALVLAALIGLLINPSMIKQAWTLYSHPLADYTRPPKFSLTVIPHSNRTTGGDEFFRNEDLMVEARAEGKAPRNVDLYFKFDNGAWAHEPMDKPDSLQVDTGQSETTSFVYDFKKVKRSLELYARSGNVESQKMHIDIVDPPRLVDINVQVDFPDYSGLANASGNPNDGNISALKGSRAVISGEANKPLENAYLLFSDSSKIKLDVKGRRLSGGFNVNDNGRYTVAMIDSAGYSNPEPIWYDIQTLEDYPPTIEIVYPAQNVDLNEDMILPLDLSITDDYGFNKMNLVWWIVSEGTQSQPTKTRIRIDNNKEVEQLIRYPWDMQELNPVPGDMIYYYCEVSDNDIVSGPKWSRSRTFMARLPSLDEILAEVQGSQEEQIEGVEEAMRQQKELQEKLTDISREMMEAAEVKWETQQQAKAAVEKQQEIAKSLEKLTEEMSQNLDKLEQNRLIGDEIAEKMRELNDLMEEIATPELREAMKKLSEALKNMNPEEMKKALDQFQMTSEELLKNLERSLSLMKQLAIEQKMDLLTELAEKILQDQKDINNDVDSANDSSGLADLENPQQANENQFKSLKEQFEELKKMDESENLVPEQSKTDAENELNNPQIPEDFSGMKMSMKSGGKGNCKSKGKRLEKNLGQLAEAMKNARNAMQSQMKSEIAKKIQKAAEDILYLSNRQEGVLDSTRAYDRTREKIRGFASDQSQIESAAGRSADLISDISKETVYISGALLRLMGQILADLSDASKNLDNSLAGAAERNETDAMANMNTIVMLLLQAKSSACSSSSGSGMKEMMEKLSQCTKGQMGINQQTLMQMPAPGVPLSMSQQQAMQNLAAQQEALRQQMQELHDQYGERGEMLGRLDALGQEMKKVVDDLSGMNVDRKTIERQEKILSRLLDAQKSVNRREYSRKRKAETGSEFSRKSPENPRKRKAETGTEVSRESPEYQDGLNGENAELMEIIKKALQEKYPRKYEKLIKAYFKSLQNEDKAFE